MAEFIEPEMVNIIHQKTQKSMTISMVHLPKGKFMFGEGSSAREVTIDYEFEIGKFPVTIKEYMTFVEDTNSHVPEWLEEDSDYNINTGTDDHYQNINQDKKAPIVGISWYDAVAFCEWLSKKSGQNYRLPTEKEWEYACRAGTKTKWSFGDDEEELSKYAWYNENSYGQAHIVGEKEPNLWGLCDMHGNVWEWCEDWYDEEEKHKVLRGGSWMYNANGSRSASRNWDYPTGRDNDVGFRLLRTLP